MAKHNKANRLGIGGIYMSEKVFVASNVVTSCGFFASVDRYKVMFAQFGFRKAYN